MTVPEDRDTTFRSLFDREGARSESPRLPSPPRLATRARMCVRVGVCTRGYDKYRSRPFQMGVSATRTRTAYTRLSRRQPENKTVRGAAPPSRVSGGAERQLAAPSAFLRRGSTAVGDLCRNRRNSLSAQLTLHDPREEESGGEESRQLIPPFCISLAETLFTSPASSGLGGTK